MKAIPSVQAAALDAAFAQINSSTGEELNNIVAVIEQHGKKKSAKETPKLTAQTHQEPVVIA